MTVVRNFVGVDLDTDRVKELLDSPNNEYVKDENISKIVDRVTNWVNTQTNVSDYPSVNVVDAIYAISVWQTYMMYSESISESLKLQDMEGTYQKLMSFREIAITYARAIGIVWPLDRFGMPITDDVDKIKANYGFAGIYSTLTLDDVYKD